MPSQKRPRRRNTGSNRLRQRLAEAEATIRAIREGHVEALIVQAPDGEQIYTLPISPTG
jgi:hypothetical protein